LQLPYDNEKEYDLNEVERYTRLLTQYDSISDKSGFEACALQIELLEYLVFTHFNDSKFEQFLIEFKNNCTNEYYNYFHRYLTLRYAREKAYLKNLTNLDNSMSWSLLVEQLDSTSYNELLLKVVSTYAVYLEYDLNNDELAITNNLRAINIAKRINSDKYRNTSFSSYGNIGLIYMKNKNWTLAKEYLLKAYNLQTSDKMNQNQAILAESISETYSSLDNKDSSLIYLKQAYQIHAKYREEEKAKSIMEVQSKYDNEKLTSQLLQKELTNNRIRTSAISFGSLATCLAAGWFLYRQRARSQLETKEKQAQLDAINARLDGEQEERKRVANALHDDISSHLSAASIHLSLLHAENSTSATKAQELISEASQRTRQLSHELYPPILLNSGLVSAISAYAESASSNQTQLFVDTEGEKINLPQELETKIYYIVIEFLQNILKHSSASRGVVTIDLQEDLLSIKISDDGCGFDVDTSSDSLGISSARARIEDMGGELIITSSAGQGSKVSFDVPIGVAS